MDMSQNLEKTKVAFENGLFISKIVEETEFKRSHREMIHPS